MHIIIVGCGRWGSELAKLLSREKHDVVVIDKNPKSFSRLGPDFNGLTVTGVGFDVETLEKAGIEKADVLASVTNGDNSNIMIAQIAQKIYKVPKVLVRIFDPARAYLYRKFGLDTICSTTIGANLVKNIILEKEGPVDFPVGKDIISVEFKKGGK